MDVSGFETGSVMTRLGVHKPTRPGCKPVGPTCSPSTGGGTRVFHGCADLLPQAELLVGLIPCDMDAGGGETGGAVSTPLCKHPVTMQKVGYVAG